MHTITKGTAVEGFACSSMIDLSGRCMRRGCPADMTGSALFNERTERFAAAVRLPAAEWARRSQIF